MLEDQVPLLRRLPPRIVRPRRDALEDHVGRRAEEDDGIEAIVEAALIPDGAPTSREGPKRLGPSSARSRAIFSSSHRSSPSSASTIQPGSSVSTVRKPRLPSSASALDLPVPDMPVTRIRRIGCRLEEPGVGFRLCRCSTDVGAAERCNRPSARGAGDEAELEKVRLVDVLDRVGLLTERRGERVDADGPAGVLLHDRTEEVAVEALEPRLVDLEQVERLARDRRRDRALVAHLGDVADAAKDAVRDARRAARAARDLLGGVGSDLDTEDPGRTRNDRGELARLVVVEPERHPEAVAQGRRQQSCARRRADERERRQVDRQRARRRSLPHHDVEPEVLERGIEDLLRGAAQSMDLVDEKDVVRLDGREDRCDVLPLERRPGYRADADSELLANDVGEARLAKTRRADEEDMVERLASPLRRVERDRELLLDARLTDEFVEPARTEAPLELLVLL